MLPRTLRLLQWAALAQLTLAAGACEKVPLLAPTGSTITLTASATALSANGSTTILGQVLEAAGTPPHSGTHVSFTTTLGVVQPSEVSTDVNGRVTVVFMANGANGTATINAISGGATTNAVSGSGTTATTGAVKIAVGTAAVGKVIVNANPASVSSQGGSTAVTARVLDINGTPLVGAPVSFATTAGSLSAGTVITDSNGAASSVLTTSTPATVTASVGAQATTTASGGGGSPNFDSVTVTINTGPTLAIKPPPTGVTKGLPAVFTFTATAGSSGASGGTSGGGSPVAIREVIVNWGDGLSESLGAIASGTGSDQTHTYANDGTYRVTGTVIDASGASSTVSASVFVTPLASPGVTVTPTPSTALVNTPIAFAIVVTMPPITGLGIQSTSIDFGDGTASSLGGSASVTVSHSYSSKGTKTVVVSVLDTTGRTTSGSTSVVINE